MFMLSLSSVDDDVVTEPAAAVFASVFASLVANLLDEAAVGRRSRPSARMVETARQEEDDAEDLPHRRATGRTPRIMLLCRLVGRRLASGSRLRVQSLSDDDKTAKM
jgi:hypothetical protein